MAMEKVLGIDTPRHSSNTREQIHSQDNCGYDLEGYVLGTVNIPSQFVVGNEVIDDVLVYLTKASTSFEVWATIERRLIWHLTRKSIGDIKQNKLVTSGVILRSSSKDTEEMEEVDLVVEVVGILVVGLVFDHNVNYVARSDILT
ncbi:hypothetical protein PVK06_019614 [Gossypium arboreum]|uniref:Uncharacterized protein n=1 Tax=Gossypium arboreum TaxID=29729 RepID=A0ABR0PKI9_GOSAR|nr:hypothetical protein PVK06_019614 [Gossypium arboreum]